ncbi:MAG: bifunctional folylpolyglutamate synthase/dihydrofolate synthase [Anaerolineaceae bacterium]|nr:bifunctional folylpolyglutamate synthase/dihydrofolate synthase [Anaerolineaceae bacterium]
MKLSAEYQAALDYLFSYVDFSMTRGQVFTPETFDLSRMKALLEALGNPQFDYPVIHIAGSKGKGSTAAMLASILREAGYHVGLYTSPHLIDFNERIQINGVSIRHEDFVALLNESKPVIESIEKITTFEVATALAFTYFSQQQIDIAVVEVGLGGRLDATNLVQPLLTVITSISLDHTAILGDTLEKIAAEKAGILKKEIPLILAHQVPSVNEHIKGIAIEKGCDVFDVDQFIQATLQHTEITHQEIQFELAGTLPWDTDISIDQPIKIDLPLVGRHQIQNASTVLLIALWLADHGVPLTLQQIRDGFAHSKWPGRFEILSLSPLMIADSAHSPDSVQRLKETIDELLVGKYVKMIFGASEDKNIEEMLQVLKDSVQHFIFSESIHPRAISAAKLAEIGDKMGISHEVCLPVENAVSSQQMNLKPNEVCIVTGSIFMAGAVKEEMINITLKPIEN